MTTLNTIIEEEKEEFEGAFMNNGVNGVLDDQLQEPKMLLMRTHFTTAMQRAYEAGKATNTQENTPDTDVKDFEAEGLIETNPTTPDTEWEEELQNIMESYIMTAELGHLAKDQLKHKEELRAYWKELKAFITTLLTSRDTYWKERVRALRKELWHDYHNAQKWSEQKAVAEALDTLLENLTKGE